MNIHDDLRVLNNGWDSGQFILYQNFIYRPISVAQGTALLARDFTMKRRKSPSASTLKVKYGHLWIEDTDINLEWKAITPSGQLLHFDRLRDIVHAGGDPHIDRSWVGRAEEVKEAIPTRMLGANYLFPEDRNGQQGLVSSSLNLLARCQPSRTSLINQLYEEHWLPDPADREVWEIIQAKCLVGVVVTKEQVNKLNRNRNSGKTTSSVCDKAVLGSFVTEFPKMLLDPRNELEATKHFYRNRHGRAFTLPETDQFTILNETGVKTWTGRDLILPPFKKVAQVPFKVTSHIWGAGSNEPFAPENGKKFQSYDRVSYLPIGQTVPKSERDRDLEQKLTAQIELDLRLTYLIDKHIPSAITTEIVKTTNMRRAEMYARLVHESVDLFLDKCCIIGVSEKFQQIQRLTCDKVQSYYAYFVRAFGIRLLRELRFDRDDDGQPMSDSDLIVTINFADPLAFKRIVDQRIGPANDSNRTSGGRSWGNLIVKLPVILFAQNEAAMRAFGTTEEIFQILDRAQTEQDALSFITEYATVVETAKTGLFTQDFSQMFPGLTCEQAAILMIWRNSND